MKIRPKKQHRNGETFYGFEIFCQPSDSSRATTKAEIHNNKIIMAREMKEKDDVDGPRRCRQSLNE